MSNLAALVSLLILLESSGNDNAVDRTGLCWGPLQVKEIYVRDVNRIAGTTFTHADAFDRPKAVRMFHIYVSHYATEERLGRPPTWQDLARIHARGPDGWRDPRAVPYWKRLKKLLEKLPAQGLPANE